MNILTFDILKGILYGPEQTIARLYRIIYFIALQILCFFRMNCNHGKILFISLKFFVPDCIYPNVIYPNFIHLLIIHLIQTTVKDTLFLARKRRGGEKQSFLCPTYYLRVFILYSDTAERLILRTLDAHQIEVECQWKGER